MQRPAGPRPAGRSPSRIFGIAAPPPLRRALGSRCCGLPAAAAAAAAVASPDSRPRARPRMPLRAQPHGAPLGAGRVPAPILDVGAARIRAVADGAGFDRKLLAALPAVRARRPQSPCRPLRAPLRQVRRAMRPRGSRLRPHSLHADVLAVAPRIEFGHKAGERAAGVKCGSAKQDGTAHAPYTRHVHRPAPASPPTRRQRRRQRRRSALRAPPLGAPLFLAVAGGGPRPPARRRQGLLTGVGHVPAGGLAAGAHPADGPAVPGAVSGCAALRGKRLAALLAVQGPRPAGLLGKLLVELGPASLAADRAGTAVRSKVAAAQPAGARLRRPCAAPRAPGVAARRPPPRPPPRRRRPLPAIPGIAGGGIGPGARQPHGALLGVGQVPAPPLVLVAARGDGAASVRAVADGAVFR